MVLQAMLGFADADIDGMYGEETVRRVKTHTGGDGKTVDGKTYIRIQREDLRSFLRAQGRTSGSEYFHPTGGIGSYGTPLKNAFGAPRPGGRKHEGQDIMLAEGKPLYAVTAGKVTWARNDSAGVIVYLHGDDGHRYSYFHLSRREGSDGMKVVANQIIGYVGDTGNSNGPHLHFGYRPDGGDYVDPRSLLDSATTS
jgi:murein DD-endopeptidase MepM/ murein hydrolase activator NlpD